MGIVRSHPSPFKGETVPFKSQAQRAKFAELVKEGKLSQAKFDEWQAATGNAKLPKKVGYKPKGLTRGVRKTR